MKVPGTNFTVNEAIDWIEFCRDQYYNYNNVPVSDLEYDFIVAATKEAVPNHPYFKSNNQPPSKRIKLKNKVNLPTKLKISNISRVFSYLPFFQAIQNWVANTQASSFAVRPNYDGVNCVLHYNKGYLIFAAICCNSDEGIDVTEYIKRIMGVPFVIPGGITCEIVGTVIMQNSVFASFAPGQFSSPYAAVRGAFTLNDYELVTDRKLDFSPWDIYFPAKNIILSEKEKNKLFAYWKFKHFDGNLTINNLEELNNFYIKLHNVKNNHVSAQLTYENVRSSGIVIAPENTSLMPSVFVPFPQENIKATATEINLQVGRQGKITRVACFDAASFENNQISSATINPYLPLNLGVGSELVVGKMGFAPFVWEATKIKNETALNITECPSCGFSLFLRKQELFCANQLCPERILAKLQHFAAVMFQGSKMQDITIKQIFSEGLLKSFTSFYEITKPALLAITNINQKTASAIYASIHKSKDAHLGTLLYALSIPGIGKFWALKIAELFNNNGSLLLTPSITAFVYIFKLKQAPAKDRSIPFYVFVMFLKWLCSSVGHQAINSLHDTGLVCLSAVDKEKHTTVNIRGKTTFPKQELEIFLNSYGYKVVPTIKSADMVICNSPRKKDTLRKKEIVSDVLLVHRLSQDVLSPKQAYLLNAKARKITLPPKIIWDLAVKNAIAMENKFSNLF